LENLVEKTHLFSQIESLFKGEKINISEKRSVLHVALRSSPEDFYPSDGKNMVPEVHAVLKQISSFSSAIRTHTLKGFTNKDLINVVVIGIGGSYLGIEFVYEALRSHPEARKLANGRKLKFLANVDPIDFTRAVEGLNAEETLFVVNSKTFTTAETILNAKSCKDWVLKHYEQLGFKKEDHNKIVNAHFCACSTNLDETSKFGIQDKERVFAFWDWVGGRFSVSSCIGVLSLSLHFGFEFIQEFLKGMRSIDQHFLHTRKVRQNLPLLLGLIGFYNTTIQSNFFI
jgi:glucose-6-phosphate isomerase